MKALIRDEAILEVARRWLRNEPVSPHKLRYAAGKVKDLVREEADTLPEGQILWLSHLAGAMNQAATVIENDKIRRRECL